MGRYSTYRIRSSQLKHNRSQIRCSQIRSIGVRRSRIRCSQIRSSAVRRTRTRYSQIRWIARAARSKRAPSQAKLKEAYRKLLNATGRVVGQAKRSPKRSATASSLPLPIGTIRSRLPRGRESLRILMDRGDGTEPANGAAITSAPSNPKRFVPGFERTQNSRLLPDVAAGDPAHRSPRLLQLTTPSVSGAPRPCRCHCHFGSSEHGLPNVASPAWFYARFPRSAPPRRG